MLVATIAMLATCGWFWAHVGDEDRTQSVLADLSSEDWGTVTVARNGQTIQILGPRL